MEQIINDLKSALAKMNEKADMFSKSSAEADFVIADLRKQMKLVSDREIAVAGKEKFYSEYDAVEKIRADVKAEKNALAKAKLDFEAEKKSVASDKESVKSEKETLSKTIAMYKQKIENCDKEVKKLEEDRKQLEAKIIENFTKNLTKK